MQAKSRRATVISSNLTRLPCPTLQLRSPNSQERECHRFACRAQTRTNNRQPKLRPLPLRPRQRPQRRRPSFPSFKVIWGAVHAPTRPRPVPGHPKSHLSYQQPPSVIPTTSCNQDPSNGKRCPFPAPAPAAATTTVCAALGTYQTLVRQPTVRSTTRARNPSTWTFKTRS